LILAIGGFLASCNEGVFAVTIENDTSSTVHAKECSDAACHRYERDVTLAPGETVRSNALSTSQIVKWWLVADEHDMTMGCIRLQFDRIESGIVKRISELEPCP
jgi:hypothetical protein